MTRPQAPSPKRNKIVPFNRPTLTGSEVSIIKDALTRGKLAGDGYYGRKCEDHFSSILGGARTFLTPSCTHSLEMAAIMLDLQPGDEVIMPSFTFVSTANAFAMRGVHVVFVDIRPDTMNIDETLIEAAITPRTRAIVPMHYGGVACEMDTILAIAAHHGLALVEDAAQCIMASYHGRPLGTIGDIGTFSFHETKNLTSGGEGGLAIINNPSLIQKAEEVREKGTDRSRFFRGEVAKYSWSGLGSSFLLNEISAAFLWAQLEQKQAIFRCRMNIFQRYRGAMQALADAEKIDLQITPAGVQHNAHLFYIKLRDIEERTRMVTFLNERGVQSAFHYVPLHSSRAGKVFGSFSGEDRFTTRESERLLRLPIFHDMTDDQQEHVIDSVLTFFHYS